MYMKWVNFKNYSLLIINYNQTRFEKPIRANKICNFASEAIKKTQKNDGKVALLKMERDIFGRLLSLSLEHRIDIETCLSFALAPIPPALPQYNGDMIKTAKSKPATALKNHLKSANSAETFEKDIYVIDGFHFLRTLGNILQNYGKISEIILRKICNTTAREIHLIFDRYHSPSIKDMEHEKRGIQNIPYQISGHTQSRYTNFMKSLNNDCFKEALIQFLAQHWENKEFSQILKDKKVYLTIGDSCFSYKVEGKNIVKTEEPEFKCMHQEADTRIIFHLSKSSSDRTVLIRSSDTDILIILLGNMNLLPPKEIWMTAGNRLEAIDCTALF